MSDDVTLAVVDGTVTIVLTETMGPPGPPGSTLLAGLDDVTVDGADTGDALIYTGAGWAAGQVLDGASLWRDSPTMLDNAGMQDGADTQIQVMAFPGTWTSYHVDLLWAVLAPPAPDGDVRVVLFGADYTPGDPITAPTEIGGVTIPAPATGVLAQTRVVADRAVTGELSSFLYGRDTTHPEDTAGLSAAGLFGILFTRAS